MVSKNNYSEKMRKIRPQKQRFSIRKFTVGASSVLIGLTFMGVNNQEAQADTTVAPEESVKVESSTASDITETMDNVVNTEEQSISTTDNQTEVMSAEENNEVENDVTASGETGNEEVKNDRSISSVETDNVMVMKNALVKPYVDFNKLEELFIVVPKDKVNVKYD